MPTILELNGYRVVIHTHDHEPTNVHMVKAGEECVIELTDAGWSVRAVYRMRDRGVAIALQIVEQHEQAILAAWRKDHGK